MIIQDGRQWKKYLELEFVAYLLKKLIESIKRFGFNNELMDNDQ